MKMLMKYGGWLLIMILAFSSLACNPGAVKKNSGIKRYNLGKASDYDISVTLPRLLRKYQFEVRNSFTSSNYTTIETEWKNRYPMEDELEVGIREGRLRMFIRVRKTSDELNYVQIEVENMVKVEDYAYWVGDEMTEDVEGEVRRFIEELRQEFEEGRLRG